MIQLKKNLLVVSIAAMLAACGGGGDDSAPSSPVAVTPPVTPPVSGPVVTPADLQTTVPGLTYEAGSQERAFVLALNQFRASIGLGLLAQNSYLDQSAKNHLAYVLTNDSYYGGAVDMTKNDPISGRSMFHIESANYPLYTGTDELARARYVGYSGAYVGEELSFPGGKGGAVALESLAATVYHRAGLMMQGLRDVGVAIGNDLSQTSVLEFGYIAPQTNASDFLGVYPAHNQTGVKLHTSVETPNPFPDLSTSNDDFPTKTGYPISVVVKEGVRLDVLTLEMVEAESGTVLSGRIMTSDNDPNRYLQSNVAFFVPSARLKPATKYSVTFSGRVSNVVVNKQWSFTTGS